MRNPLEKIYKSVEKFLTPLTLEDTYAIITKEGTKLSGSYGGLINIYEKGDWIRVYQSHSVFPRVKIRKKGFTYKAFKLGEPLVADHEEIEKVHPAYKNIIKNWKWSIFIPLSYGNKKLGVLTLLQNKGVHPNKNKLNVLKVFGSLATLAIRKTQLYQEINDALDTRDLFISMAAHELKTPLTTINAYVQLLQKKLSKKNNINKKWVEQLSKATERLNKLVLELLQIEQIKRGKLDYNFKNIHLKEIIKEAIDDFVFINPRHKILFSNRLDNNKDIIKADPDKLLQVFNNILNNAAKFSKEGTEITIFLGIIEQQFIITIKDQGLGISKKELSKIFNRFYKGQNKNIEGLGLGLYLSKKIIEKHNGIITLDSKKNKGSTVKILLNTNNI